MNNITEGLEKLDLIEQIKKEFIKLSDNVFTELRENMSKQLSGRVLVDEAALEHALQYLSIIDRPEAQLIAKKLSK